MYITIHQTTKEVSAVSSLPKLSESTGIKRSKLTHHFSRLKKKDFLIDNFRIVRIDNWYYHS